MQRVTVAAYVKANFCLVHAFVAACWLFSKLTFRKILSGTLSKCKTDWYFVDPYLGPNSLHAGIMSFFACRFFFKIKLSKISFRINIKVTNILDPKRGAWSGRNWLQKKSADNNSHAYKEFKVCPSMKDCIRTIVCTMAIFKFDSCICIYGPEFDQIWQPFNSVNWDLTF